MTIGVGIIGAGIMGERLLRAALEHAGDVVHVTGIWDHAPAALDRVAGNVPGLPRAASAEAVIEGAECVYVATPPGTHLGYARAALAAGRAAFLEKPLAVDLADARAFVAEAAARIAVNFPFAMSPAVERLQTWLRDNVAGAPRGFLIDVGFAAWPRPWQQGAAGWLDGAAEGGFTREVVSHFLFLSRRLLGPLYVKSSEVEYGAEGGTERRIAARLDAGGLPGRVSGSVGGTAEDEHNAWTIQGVANFRLRDWSIAERQRPDGTWVSDPDALPNERMRPLTLRRQLEQVARMTRGEPHHLATVVEAFDVQQVVEAILTGRSMTGVAEGG
jgi:predicted dehydrogenase